MREDGRDLHYRGEAYKKILRNDICKAIMSCDINKREIVEYLKIYRG